MMSSGKHVPLLPNVLPSGALSPNPAPKIHMDVQSFIWREDPAVQMKWTVLAVRFPVQSGNEQSSYTLENPEYVRRAVGNGQFN